MSARGHLTLWTYVAATTFCFVVCIAADVFAQPGRGGRGGPPFGGGSGRGGPPFGGGPGFRGGGPPFGGGSPMGGGGPSDFIRRLDTNGNGTLDPDETQGRARYFLERIASSVPGLDLNRPIPIDRLSQAMERLRDGRGGDSRGGDSRGRDRGGSSLPSPSVDAPVPGFGIDEALPIPLGFGAEGELFTVSVQDEDKREADERFRRYDSNRDGFLDREEIRRGRWSDDPFAYDRNGDGKLTPAEMAVRYARRRIQRDGDSTTSSSSGRSSSTSRGSSGRSSSGRDSSGGSSSSDSRMAMMVDGMMRRYDRDGNGVLEGDEFASSRFIGSADANGDKRITKEEIAEFFQSRMASFGRGGDRGGDGGRGSFGFGRGGFGGDRGGSGGDAGDRGGGDSSYYSRRDSSEGEDSDDSSGAYGEGGSPSYRFRSIDELLPEDLPTWFARGDMNGDGQIAMSEFTSDWNAKMIADFRQFDLNRDGIITPGECERATKDGAVRGIVEVPVASSASGGSSSSASSESDGLDERYAGFARRIIGKYDDSGDGVLTKDEWDKMSSPPDTADGDGDGKVTLRELVEFYKSQG